MRGYRPALAAAAAIAALAIAGCGTAASTSSTSPPASQAPAALPYNPVTILKLAGAIPDPGEVYGRPGGLGGVNNMVADGQFRPGHISSAVMGNAEYLTVISCSTAAGQAAALKAATPADAQAVISGPHLSVIIVNGAQGVAWGSPAEHGPSPQQVAARVGGTVVSS